MEQESAARDTPHDANRAMTDGFAARLSAAGRTLAVAGEVAAREDGPLSVTEDSCIEILTGAPRPPGTEGGRP